MKKKIVTPNYQLTQLHSSILNQISARTLRVLQVLPNVCPRSDMLFSQSNKMGSNENDQNPQNCIRNLHSDAPTLEEASLLKQTDGIVRVLEQNRWNCHKFWTESLIGAEPGHLAWGFSLPIRRFSSLQPLLRAMSSRGGGLQTTPPWRLLCRTCRRRRSSTRRPAQRATSASPRRS